MNARETLVRSGTVENVAAFDALLARVESLEAERDQARAAEEVATLLLRQVHTDPTGTETAQT
jgi:hypothetical protein